MSALDPLAVLLFVVAMALLIRWVVRRDPAGDWEPFHRFESGCRKVYVRRGSDLEPVGEVRAGDPAYDESFLALMDRARERAAMLNGER